MPVVWLTDLDVADPIRLGLTSTFLGCDRTERQIPVDVDATRWKHFARRYDADRRWLRELHRHGDPYHWFVTTNTITVPA